MWSLLKKAGEFIVPESKPNSIEEFKTFCETVLSSISTGDRDDPTYLLGSLNNIVDYLIEEIDLDDHPCLDYFVSESIMQQIVDSITKEIPRSHVEPIIDFFKSFVSSRLSKLFLQVTVLRPFSKLLSELDTLYQKDPETILEFVSFLWKKLRSSPLAFEMLTINGKYPLFDFFFLFVFNPEPTNNFMRDAIETVVSKSPPAFSPTFFDYFRSHIYPKFIDFIIQCCECVTTIQINQTFVLILNWIDAILTYDTEFPQVESLFVRISKFEPPHQLLSISIILSFFISPLIYDKAVQFAQTQSFNDMLCSCLESKTEFDRKAAVTCLKTILRCDSKILPNLFPTQHAEPADVLSLLPPEWLTQIEGTLAIKAYQTDAISRITYYEIDRKSLNVSESSNPKYIFPYVLSLLKTFKDQSIGLCLSLSELILMILAISPNLISDDLANTFREAIEPYKAVTSFEMPTTNCSDTPQLRASILAEFGKAIHATFTASEMLKSQMELFNKADI